MNEWHEESHERALESKDQLVKILQSIVGALVIALGVVMWWLILDTRNVTENTRATTDLNSQRIFSLEKRADFTDRQIDKMNAEMDKRH